MTVSVTTPAKAPAAMVIAAATEKRILIGKGVIFEECSLEKKKKRICRIDPTDVKRVTQQSW